MAQQKNQAPPKVYAITTVLPEVDGNCPTATSPSVSGTIPKQPHEFIAMSVQRTECSEICRAIDLLNNLALAVAEVHRAARRRQSLELQHLNQAIDALSGEFERDPNTLFWALAASRRMHYLGRRSVGCAVWALALGRHLDFDRAALHELMLGAALLDIGKVKVPIVIQAKTSALNETEQNFARRHVAQGVHILESVAELSAATIEMVRSHHERIDGSGYPFRLKGDEISLYAQIAGIVDSFDALSLNRYYADGLSGHAALSMLQKQRGQKFDPHLIDKFVSAIGKFPTGTWVEFPDGRTGVVCSQDPAGQDDPQVVLIADENQQPYLAVRRLSLDEHSEARALPPAERPLHAGAMERSLQAAVYARRPQEN